MMDNEPQIIRDSVKGVNKYARIPIRRKRTPILAEEFQEMFDFQYRNALSQDDIRDVVIRQLDEAGRYKESGKWITYLDFMKIIEVETEEQ